MGAADVLIVEDDVALAGATSRYLARHGYAISAVHCAADGIERIERTPPRLVLLDLNLPDRDGFWVCSSVRPVYAGFILVLTSRRGGADQIRALEMGADDYVAKPVEPRVLLARVRAALRRVDPALASFGRARVIDRDLWVDGAPLGLTEVEFALFCALSRAQGEAVSRDDLFEGVLGRPWDGLNRTIDVHISSLRKKLGPWVSVDAVRGVGYALSVGSP